jgi:hypothetical protein
MAVERRLEFEIYRQISSRRHSFRFVAGELNSCFMNYIPFDRTQPVAGEEILARKLKRFSYVRWTIPATRFQTTRTI